MTHALVIGGTGMLRRVSEHLSGCHDTLTVVARTPHRLEALAATLDPACTYVPLALDYRDGAALRRSLQDVQASHGCIDRAVCWIHSVAPQAPAITAQAIGSAGATPCALLHVLGSAALDPTAGLDETRARLSAIEGIAYRQVVLGFVLEGGRSRWLTNAEIGAGVVAALDADADPSIVGTVRPWSARP